MTSVSGSGENSDADTHAFVAAARGVKVQVFDLSADNARAFWTWRFLPARLSRAECDAVAEAILAAVRDVMTPRRVTGT